MWQSLLLQKTDLIIPLACSRNNAMGGGGKQVGKSDLQWETDFIILACSRNNARDEGGGGASKWEKRPTVMPFCAI